MDKQKLAMLWLRRSLIHLVICDKDECDYYWEFVYFLRDNGVSFDQEREWRKIAVEQENSKK